MCPAKITGTPLASIIEPWELLSRDPRIQTRMALAAGASQEALLGDLVTELGKLSIASVRASNTEELAQWCIKQSVEDGELQERVGGDGKPLYAFKEGVTMKDIIEAFSKSVSESNVEDQQNPKDDRGALPFTRQQARSKGVSLVSQGCTGGVKQVLAEELSEQQTAEGKVSAVEDKLQVSIDNQPLPVPPGSQHEPANQAMKRGDSAPAEAGDGVENEEDKTMPSEIPPQQVSEVNEDSAEHPPAEQIPPPPASGTGDDLIRTSEPGLISRTNGAINNLQRDDVVIPRDSRKQGFPPPPALGVNTTAGGRAPSVTSTVYDSMGAAFNLGLANPGFRRGEVPASLFGDYVPRTMKAVGGGKGLLPPIAPPSGGDGYAWKEITPAQMAPGSGNILEMSLYPPQEGYRIEQTQFGQEYLVALKRVYTETRGSARVREEKVDQLRRAFTEACGEEIPAAPHWSTLVSIAARAAMEALRRPRGDQSIVVNRNRTSLGVGACVSHGLTAAPRASFPALAVSTRANGLFEGNYPENSGPFQAIPEYPKLELRQTGGGSSSRGAPVHPTETTGKDGATAQTGRTQAAYPPPGTDVKVNYQTAAVPPGSLTDFRGGPEESFDEGRMGPQSPLDPGIDLTDYWGTYADRQRDEVMYWQRNADQLRREQEGLYARVRDAENAYQQGREAYRDLSERFRLELEETRLRADETEAKRSAEMYQLRLMCNELQNQLKEACSPARSNKSNSAGTKANGQRAGATWPWNEEQGGEPSPSGQATPPLAVEHLSELTPQSGRGEYKGQNAIDNAPKKQLGGKQNRLNDERPPKIDPELLENDSEVAATGTIATAPPTNRVRDETSSEETRALRGTTSPAKDETDRNQNVNNTQQKKVASGSPDDPNDPDSGRKGNRRDNNGTGRRDHHESAGDDGPGGNKPPPKGGSSDRDPPPPPRGNKGGGESSPGDSNQPGEETESRKNSGPREAGSDRMGRLSYADIIRILPMFARPSAARSWENYLAKFRKICSQNKVAVEDYARILLPKLEGDAEVAVGALSSDEQDSFDALINCLTKRYVKIRDQEDASLALDNRQQKEGETVEQYGLILSELARAAYPVDHAERRRAFFRRLKTGLREVALRSRFKDFHKANPLCTEEDMMDELKEHDPLHVPGGALIEGAATLRVQGATGDAGRVVEFGQDASPAVQVNAVNNRGQAGQGGGGGGQWGRKKNNKNKKKGGGGPNQPNQQNGGQQQVAAVETTNYTNNNQVGQKSSGQQWSRLSNQPGPGRGRGRGFNQPVRDERNRPGSYDRQLGQSFPRGKPRVARDISKDVCHRCGRPGHWARDCDTGMLVLYCPSCPTRVLFAPEEGQYDEDEWEDQGNEDTGIQQ